MARNRRWTKCFVVGPAKPHSIRDDGVRLWLVACGGLESEVVLHPPNVDRSGSRPRGVCRRCWAAWCRHGKPEKSVRHRKDRSAMCLDKGEDLRPPVGETRTLITGEVQKWSGRSWVRVKGTSVTFEEWSKAKEAEREQAKLDGRKPGGYKRKRFS